MHFERNRRKKLKTCTCMLWGFLLDSYISLSLYIIATYCTFLVSFFLTYSFIMQNIKSSISNSARDALPWVRKKDLLALSYLGNHVDDRFA